MKPIIESRDNLKAGFWYVVSNLILKGISFVTIPVFTRLLTKSEVGYFSNLTSWINLLMVIATLDLTSSIYLAAFDYKNTLEKYVSSVLALGTICTGFFYLLIMCFKDFFLNFFCIDESSLHIMFFVIAFQPALEMFNIKNRTQGKYRSTVILSLISCGFSTIIALILVYFYHMGLKGRIYGTYIPQILVNVGIYVFVIKEGNGFSWKYWKYALGLSMPLIFHDLAHIVLSSSDRIMITKILGNEDNALYSISYSCGSIISIIWSSMNNAWSPWAYSCMNKGDIKSLNKAVKQYTIFFVIIVLGAMLVAPEVLYVFGGESYASSVGMIPIVMVSYVFVFVYSLYVNIEFYHKKQRLIAIGTILAATLNLVLNYCFIGKYGYYAAAYTTLIGYAFLFLYNYLVVKKIKSNYYSSIFFLIVLLLSVCFIPLMEVLYLHNTVRYMVICAVVCYFMIISFIRKNSLIKAIKAKSIDKIIDIYSPFYVIKNESEVTNKQV